MSIHLGASYDALLHGAAPDLAGPEFNPNDLSRLTYFRGRVALAAILRGIGVRVGDEVLIQGFTCTAVPEAVLSLGARPRYVDVEDGGPNMDADDLARKITARSAAVVIQHTFGLPADVTRLLGVAREWGVPLVEDCAHTIASRVDGRTVGSFGAAAFYSYEASKPIFIGIGGSAVCNDAGLADALTLAYGEYAEPSAATQLQLAAMFLAHRVAYRPSAYWMVRALYRRLVVAGILRGNYNRVTDETGPALDFGRRMGRTQAALLLRALKRLDAQSLHRRWVADHYRTGIRATGVAHIPVATNADPVFGRYPMLTESRGDVLEGARRAKVELADFYATPVHPLKGDDLRRVGYEPGSCPRAEWIADRIISLPTGPQVDRRQVQRAIDYLNS